MEVIADDFLISGFGNKVAEALANHDVNLQSSLDRAWERGLKLNPNKVKLRCSSVSFFHWPRCHRPGPAADPDKTTAIAKMPMPTIVKLLEGFLGMVQYLAK